MKKIFQSAIALIFVLMLTSNVAKSQQNKWGIGQSPSVQYKGNILKVDGPTEETPIVIFKAMIENAMAAAGLEVIPASKMRLMCHGLELIEGTIGSYGLGYMQGTLIHLLPPKKD
jgi:hypothetical protein